MEKSIIILILFNLHFIYAQIFVLFLFTGVDVFLFIPLFFRKKKTIP